MPQVVIQRTVDGFQRQYGSLWEAAEAYLDRAMEPGQACAFESVVDARWVSVVATARFERRLVQILVGRAVQG